MNKKRALIFGVRDMRNKGDLAILKSQIHLLKNYVGYDEIAVSTVNQRELKTIEPRLTVYPALVDAWIIPDSIPKISAYSMRVLLLFLWGWQMLLLPFQLYLAKLGYPLPYRSELYKFTVKCNAFYFTGGNQILDMGSKTDTVGFVKLFPRWLFLIALFWQVFLFKRIVKAKVIIFPQSIGLFRTSIAKILAKAIIRNSDVCFLREKISEVLAEEIGVSDKTKVVLDIAFHLVKENVQVKSKFPVLAISPRITPMINMDNYVNVHAQIADWWIDEKGGSVIFLPSNELGDRSGSDDAMITEMIMAKLKNHEQVEYISMCKAEMYKGVLGSVDLLLATRMHPSILAVTSMVPYVALYYEHKQEGLAEELGMKDYLVDIGNFKFEDLKRTVDAAFVNRKEIQKQLLSLKEKIDVSRNLVVNTIKDIVD